VLLDPVAIAVIVAAPFIGSFLGVVAIRLTRVRTIVFGRSACDACGATLGPLELVPLVSFAALRGRCSHCGAGIDPLHPLMEAGALAIAVWAAFVTPGWIVAASCLLGWTLMTLAAIDARTGLLPDVLTLPLAAAGLAVAFAIDRTVLLGHVIGAAAGFLAFAALAEIYRRLRGRDGLGLGDAKLLAASGAWLSWSGLPTTVLYAAFIGLAFVLLRRARGAALHGADHLAFGPALAAATWLVWLYGPLVPS
jgi:leader peptidase (prepilin peptidase)/N-methyltransferase